MVIPRSRSAGRKSVVVLPVSTDPDDDRYSDCSKIDSVRVVFPESSLCQNQARLHLEDSYQCGQQEPCFVFWRLLPSPFRAWRRESIIFWQLTVAIVELAWRSANKGKLVAECGSLLIVLFLSCIPFVPPSPSLTMADPVDRIASTIRQRQASVPDHPLNTIPNDIKPNGRIPNTPLAASTISFLLGSLFSLGVFTFVVGGYESYWWSTYQLGLFVAAWSAFHWGEFAVTAGWNLEKCSVDCEL